MSISGLNSSFRNDFVNLETLPDIFNSCHKPRKPLIILESPIEESEKTDILFKWINSCDLSYESQLQLAGCLGRFFSDLHHEDCARLVNENCAKNEKPIRNVRLEHGIKNLEGEELKNQNRNVATT